MSSETDPPRNSRERDILLKIMAQRLEKLDDQLRDTRSEIRTSLERQQADHVRLKLDFIEFRAKILAYGAIAGSVAGSVISLAMGFIKKAMEG